MQSIEHMTRTVIFALAAGLVGCGNGSLQPSPGTGGSGGLGRGGGNSAGSGGSAAGGGSKDAGGVVGLDAGTCPTWATPPVVRWSLMQAEAGVRGAQAVDGGADAGRSGCTRKITGSDTDVACAGGAWLRADGGSPSVVWDDGTQLVWDTSSWNERSSSAVPAAGDQRVWASLDDLSHVVCPVCGATTTVTIEVRENEGGKLLFLARTGPSSPEPTSEQLVALFGVGADLRSLCAFHTADGCTPVVQTINEHVLQTTPVQVIPPGIPAAVATSNGLFDVLWYSVSEQQTGQPQTCVDGAPSGPPMGFAASRVLPSPVP